MWSTMPCVPPSNSAREKSSEQFSKARPSLPVHLDTKLGETRTQHIRRTQPRATVPADRPERGHRVEEIVDIGAWLEPELSDLEPPAQSDVHLAVSRLEQRVRRHEVHHGDAAGREVPPERLCNLRVGEAERGGLREA